MAQLSKFRKKRANMADSHLEVHVSSLPIPGSEDGPVIALAVIAPDANDGTIKYTLRLTAFEWQTAISEVEKSEIYQDWLKQ